MHELSVTHDIIAIVLKYAETNDVTSIKKISLEIGELSDLQSEWLQWYFDMTAKDTVAEGAILEIERVPVRMECDSCGTIFLPDLHTANKVLCEGCGSTDIRMVSGTEYTVKSMEAI